MKKILYIICLFIAQSACALSQQLPFQCPDAMNCSTGNVLVTSKEVGSIYLNGRYTGKHTPSMLNLPNGEYNIAIGTEQSRNYLKRKISVTKHKKNVHFSIADKVKPSVWKALFVGVPTVFGQTDKGQCSTHFSKKDLDDAYSFFRQNLNEQIEPLSYGTVQWQIDRRDLTKPVELSYNPNNKWFTLEAEQGLAELNNVQPGEYDTVFLFWREQSPSCSFSSPYFGLAWLEPTSEDTRQTGYVTIKFNPGDIGVEARIQQYLREDPGVWTHEWLHVVIERFYPKLNVHVPFPPENQLILHAAGAYGYHYPWMNWYKDLISGQVPLGKTFSGIGPEALLGCSIRDKVKKSCSIQAQ